MKEEFIRFLKDYRSFEEFKKEIRPYVMSDLTAQFEEACEFVLCDGCIFFWKSARTDVDWKKLNDMWQEIYRERED